MANDTMYPIPVYGQNFRFIFVQDGALNQTGVISAVLTNVITNGDTTHAPTGDAVFDALALKADDSLVVHKAGTETITGAKTFTNGIISQKSSTGVSVKNSTGVNTMDLGHGFGSDTDGHSWIYNRANGDIVFGTNNIERGRVRSDGALIWGNNIVSTGTLAALQTQNRGGTSKTYSWYSPLGADLQLDVSGAGTVFRVDNSGNTTANGSVTSSGTFKSSTTNVTLSNDGSAGGVFLRPNGAGSSTGQTVINSAGTLSVSGDIINSVGTVGTQTIMQSHAWTNGVPRWKWVFETNASMSLYGYNTSGVSPVQALNIATTSAGGANVITSTMDIKGRDLYASRGDGTGVIYLNATADRYLYYDGTIYNLPTANLSVGGAVLAGGIELGYRDIPRITGGFDRGKMFATSAGQTLTTGPAAGSTYSIYNDSASAITLTQGAGLTLRLAGTATTGNRTLAARGIATLWYNSTTEAIISGNVT